MKFRPLLPFGLLCVASSLLGSCQDRVEGARDSAEVKTEDQSKVVSAAVKPGWLTDFKQAQAEAKEKKKLLFVDFTGSDWCGYCIRLEREVFSKPAFVEYANKYLVLLEIDFPRRKELPAEQMEQNRKLAQQFGVQGFPTIIVFDPEGNPLGSLGYAEGGVDPFIAALETARKRVLP